MTKLIALPDTDREAELSSELFTALVNGDRPHTIARRHDCSIDRVLQEIRANLMVLDDNHRHELHTRELARIEAQQTKLHQMALEGDVGASNSFVKLSERKSSLLGLDAPIPLDMQLVSRTPAGTSTDKIAAVPKSLCTDGGKSEDSESGVA